MTQPDRVLNNGGLDMLSAFQRQGGLELYQGDVPGQLMKLALFATRRIQTRLIASEQRSSLAAAIQMLPFTERAVVIMRTPWFACIGNSLRLLPTCRNLRPIRFGRVESFNLRSRKNSTISAANERQTTRPPGSGVSRHGIAGGRRRRLRCHGLIRSRSARPF